MGILLVLLSLVGGYVFLYSGIIQVISGLATTPVVASVVAIGIMKIIFSGLIGWIVTSLLAIPGISVLQSWLDS
jgi:hypothetical protein